MREFDTTTRVGNGFVFDPFTAEDRVMALRRALSVHAEPSLWRSLQRNGMELDFGWRTSADGYDRLYGQALQRVEQGRIPTLESVRDTF